MTLGWLRLDLHQVLGYRLSLIGQLAHGVLVLALFYFLSESIGAVDSFNGKYFPYVAAGLCFHAMFFAWSAAASAKIRELQSLQALELLWMSPVSRLRLCLGAGAWDGVAATAKTIVILSAAHLWLGMEWRGNLMNLAAVTAFIFLFSQVISTIGVASVLLWKRFNLAAFAGSLSVTLLSGIYFPVKMLPAPLQALAQLIPIPHLLALFRWALTGETQFVGVAESWSVALAWLVLLGAFAAAFFTVAERRVMNQGTLAHL